MSSFQDVAVTIRRVLEQQLRLKCVTYEDNLLELDRDFPTDEVIKEVLEEFGSYEEPMLYNWSGTFGDLVRVVEAEILRQK